MGNTQGTDIYITEPHLSDLCDSHSLIGTWRDTKYGSCMRLDYVSDGKLGYLVGSSSTGSYAEARLTGSIVDLILMLADGYSFCQYKGLLEISNDSKHTHTIRWIKKNTKNGHWYITSSWMKI